MDGTARGWLVSNRMWIPTNRGFFELSIHTLGSSVLMWVSSNFFLVRENNDPRRAAWGGACKPRIICPYADVLLVIIGKRDGCSSGLRASRMLSIRFHYDFVLGLLFYNIVTVGDPNNSKETTKNRFSVRTGIVMGWTITCRSSQVLNLTRYWNRK